MKEFFHIILITLSIFTMIYYNNKLFLSYNNLTIFLGMLLLNTINDILENMIYKQPIKSTIIIKHNIKTSLIGFSLYILLKDLTHSIKGVNTTLLFISFTIALLTKNSIKKYNLSYI
jgi:hypothetical protein